MNKGVYESFSASQIDYVKRKLEDRMTDLCNDLSRQHVPTEAEQQVTLAMMYSAYLKLKDHNILGADVGHICTEICRLILNGSIEVSSGGLSVRGQKELMDAKEILLELWGMRGPIPSRTSRTIEDFMAAIKKSKQPNANETTHDQKKIGRIQYRDIPAPQNASYYSKNDTIRVEFCELGGGGDPGESSPSNGQRSPAGWLDPCGGAPIV